MTQETIEYVEVPGATLWTARQGSGPAIVMLHGGPGLWDYMGPVAGMVDDLATVYRYDQRASGRSSGGPPFTVKAAVADLEALREHWGVEHWVVLGHSWGATLALAYCLAHPDRVQALIYISGVGIYTGWREDFAANMNALIPPEERKQLAELRAQLVSGDRGLSASINREYCVRAWSAEIVDRENARELAQSLLVDGVQANWEVNRVLAPEGERFAEQQGMPAQLAALRVPTLVVHGEIDPRPAWAGQRVADHIPSAEFVLLPGVGHFVWLDSPDLLSAALRQFLVKVL
ncbi:MAG: proline iminopeptidase [Chloroflexia bacterium]|jgi:proline iminopeptidase|nr:proline iminopeptidase [Chloroflexia bacterium]